jgi:hypothetical protein
MQKIFMASLCGLFSSALMGQQLSQQVLNSSGMVFQSANFSISSSVGEPFTTSFSNADVMLTQGFIQPIRTDVPTSLIPFANLDDNYKVFPNVTSEGVSYEFSDKTLVAQKFEVYGNDGRLVKTLTNPDNFLNLSDLSNGIYWLRPIVADKQFGVKKVVKTR